MFKGFICHITGAAISPDACLQCSLAGGCADAKGQWCPFTPPIVRGLIESNQPRNLLAYSATELSGCTRKVRLQEQVDFFLKPSEAYWAFRGRLVHSILEYAHQDTGVMREQRFYAEIGEHLFTGQVDLFYPDRRHLVDYKTTKEVPRWGKMYICPQCETTLRESKWGFKKGTKVTCGACGAVHQADALQPMLVPPAPYDGHVRQLNLYAWLLRQHGYTVETAEVVYIDMSQPLRLGVPLWPEEQTLAYLQERFAALEEVGPDALPEGVWGDEDEKWQCNYCPVAAECQRRREVAEATAATATPALTPEAANALLYG